MKLIAILALMLAAVSATRAETFVFETNSVRLSIRSDGTASSLIEKQSGQERLRPEKVAFAAVRKGDQVFPASQIERRGGAFHVSFGSSGVSADYRITASADSIVVELARVEGEDVQEFRLFQLSTPLANVGGLLGVEWDDNFAVCLMGLSERVNVEIAGRVISASVYPKFGMQGERVALLAVPTPRFLETVQQVEHDFHLPSPTIDGQWAKLSVDARASYLFTDLTEANADETIRYAKLGGFRYILIYASTWSSSLGSYPINFKNFPHGEKGLKFVIDKCHAAGLKVGIHVLTSLVGKNDPLVRPKPNPGLLKDGEAVLAKDFGEDASAVMPDSSLMQAGLPGQAGDFQIDDEILHCGNVGGARLLDCRRGFAGTTRAPHHAGAEIQHLVERGGAYLANLRSPLAEVISGRVADLVNRLGVDMIYFDGGELNSANGNPWYWVGVQQSQIWERSKRNLLVQGSGATHWTWHIFTRGTCDDAATVAVKEYLDDHKIADSWRYYHANFLPAELGWLGIYSSAPDHSATTPDEIEYDAVRMLALDSPLSFETSLSALKANGRTEEMLKLLGKYERLRMSGTVPKTVRERLKQGEWHMTQSGEFHPIRYDAYRSTVPGTIAVNNRFGNQPLKFRLQAEPELAAPGDPSNIPLLKSNGTTKLSAPAANAAMPGALIRRTEFSQALDLTTHRALAVQLDVEGPEAATGHASILNLQLEAGGKRYRDYLIDLNFRGPRTVVLAEPNEAEMLAEFRPAASNYSIKSALFSFNYANVVALNLRWMRYPSGSGVTCHIRAIEALTERDNHLSDIEISTGLGRIVIPGELKTGEYAEYWGTGPVSVFDANGVLLRTVSAGRAPDLKAGENSVAVWAAGPGNVKLTAITLGKKL